MNSLWTHYGLKKCCRYNEECRRRTTCLYRHDQIKTNPDYNNALKDENEDLRTKINEIKDKLDEANANLKMHVKAVETLKARAQDVEASNINELQQLKQYNQKLMNENVNLVANQNNINSSIMDLEKMDLKQSETIMLFERKTEVQHSCEYCKKKM